jgi:hypothetical protein
MSYIKVKATNIAQRTQPRYRSKPMKPRLTELTIIQPHGQILCRCIS